MKFTFFIRAAIVVLWIASMGALLRHEAYPEWFTRTIPGYKGLISETLLARESWSRILIGGTPAGYSHTTLGVNNDTDGNLLEISNRLHLRFLLGGEMHRVRSLTDIILDRDFRLVSFAASVSAGPISVSANGHQLPDGRFEVTLNAGGASSVRTIAIPPDTLLYSPGQELALRNLRPGTRLTLKTLNPLTLQATAVMIESEERETITLDGASVAVTRLVTSWQGIALKSWINDDGLVVRQETPLGWLIEACTPETAMASMTQEHPPPALFGAKGATAPFNLLFGKALGTP